MLSGLDSPSQGDRQMHRYNQAVAALYGNGPAPKPRAARRQNGDSEAAEHIRLACWLKKNNILFYHPANGGTRIKREAYQLKLMGVSPGVPDLCIPIARYPHHGLYIELKRKEGGVTSAAQAYWLKSLLNEGYKAVVCKGFEDGRIMVENYLKGEKWIIQLG
jgi:VRR-NUC domain